MEDYITRAEHEAFKELCASENRRMEQEDKRINQRLLKLEDTVTEINSLAMSVEKLAINMQRMMEKQDGFAEKLDEMEQKPMDKYEKIKTIVATALITTIVSVLVGHFLNGMGIG